METEDPWDEQDGEELEAEIMQADHSFGADLQGTTPEEALDGLGLDGALARERPGERAVDEVISVEAEAQPDVESELVADGSVERDDFASPEESALSIRPTPPGATDHEDPHPADEG